MQPPRGPWLVQLSISLILDIEIFNKILLAINALHVRKIDAWVDDIVIQIWPIVVGENLMIRRLEHRLLILGELIFDKVLLGLNIPFGHKFVLLD